MVNVTKRRNGEIVSANVARELIASGAWEVTNISQVIDGVSYWRVDNDSELDYCLVAIVDWE